MQARSVSDDATAHSHPEMTDRFRPQREEGFAQAVAPALNPYAHGGLCRRCFREKGGLLVKVGPIHPPV
jgi:hypothetical protein